MTDLDRSDLDLLAPLGRVAPPGHDTMLAIATRFTEAANSVAHTNRRPLLRKVAITGGAFLATAAVAATVIVVTTQDGNPRTDTADPSSVPGLVIAALDSHAQWMQQTRMTASNWGDTVEEEWVSVSQPSVGEQVIDRDLETRDGAPLNDGVSTYAQPQPDLPMPANCENIAGPGPTNPHNPGYIVNGHTINVQYWGRTYSEVPNGCASIETQTRDNVRNLVPTLTALAGRQVVDGQQTIELVDKIMPKGKTPAVQLWVDASTYLPVQLITESGGETVNTSGGQIRGSSQVLTYTFQFMPDNAANRRHLDVSIPQGFAKVPGDGQN